MPYQLRSLSFITPTIPGQQYKLYQGIWQINPLKPSGKYMYHLLQQSITPLHFVFMKWKLTRPSLPLT
jgi:hypothetical protein